MNWRSLTLHMVYGAIDEKDLLFDFNQIAMHFDETELMWSPANRWNHISTHVRQSVEEGERTKISEMERLKPLKNLTFSMVSIILFAQTRSACTHIRFLLRKKKSKTHTRVRTHTYHISNMRQTNENRPRWRCGTGDRNNSKTSAILMYFK